MTSVGLDRRPARPGWTTPFTVGCTARTADLLGRLVVGHDRHDLRESEQQASRSGRGEAVPAVELELQRQRVLLVDADEPHVPVLDRGRVDLVGESNGVQAGAVADQRAADGDVVEQQAALVDAAVADVAEAEQDVCPAYADRS